MENTRMTQKLPRLYKVERYAYDFVVAESDDEAKLADLAFDFETTVTEITEMSPNQTGYTWEIKDAKTGEWVGECGEWFAQNAELRRQQEKKAALVDAAFAKLTREEQAAILELVSK